MKPVVTASQMREMDQICINDYKIPGLVLMENAGSGAASTIMSAYNARHVAIFCGKGNNGGDGFVIGRHLFNAGMNVQIILVGSREDVRGDALVNLNILEQMEIPLVELFSVEQLQEWDQPDLIVDALLGTGITGAVRGVMADVIKFVNDTLIPVVAVDIPSGLNCDTGQYDGVCVEADMTVTMAALKRGLALSPGKIVAGDVIVTDISMPPQVPTQIGNLCYTPNAEDIVSRLPERPIDGHKGTFGKAAVIAGSTGLTGAAVLASMGAYRTGAGLVACGCPKSLNSILETKMTEVMTRPLPETPSGTLGQHALDDILEFLEWADVAAIGPGLSSHPDTVLMVQELTKSLDMPFVLDADGINAFQGNLKFFKHVSAPCILTPHVGELARLLKTSIESILEDPIRTALDTAQSLDQVLVLKGAPTIIASPEGDCLINPTGNSGMATGGSGDVLTGIITGLLAQGMPPFDAAFCGVYLHGLAGDLAAEAVGEQAMLAEDILNHIGEAYLTLEDLCDND